MPTKVYKEPRQCACGYTTLSIQYWYSHKKCCKTLNPSENEQLKKQIVFLESQLAAKDEQLAAKERQIELLQAAAHPTPKPKQKSKKRKRKSFPEPFRRKIATRQDWKCANPDGKCIKLDLEEYDIDHIIPLHQGGTNYQNNLQALCPACQRRKTEKEACMQVEASGSEVTGQEEVMVAG